MEGVVKRLVLDVGDIRAHNVIRFRLVWTLAVGVFFRGGWKCFVGDPHLDVVGLARANSDRLVLRLPSETSDSAVVATTVGMAGDAERSAQGSGGIMLREDLAILD